MFGQLFVKIKIAKTIILLIRQIFTLPKFLAVRYFYLFLLPFLFNNFQLCICTCIHVDPCLSSFLCKYIFHFIIMILAKVTDWSRVVIAYEPVWAIGTGNLSLCRLISSLFIAGAHEN